MSHQDLDAAIKGMKGKCLKQGLKWLLKGVCWSNIKFRKDCSWTASLLAVAAMLWAWSDEETLKERFRVARRLTMFLFGVQHQLAQSYQAFVKLLWRWTDDLNPPIRTALRKRMQQDLPDCWGLHGFVLFAADGSRVALPRTDSNEQAYSANRKSKSKTAAKQTKAQAKKAAAKKRSRQSSHSKKASSPQMWLTTLWHIGTGLPWNWRKGPADSSERAHLLEMLESLPAEALVVADAGFVGYEYWKAILDSGRQFLIRVGSNVTLLKQLGCARESEQTVYLWPDNVAKKNSPPLILRMIVIHNGRHPVYLVTSVCSKSRLSDTQLIDIYRSRWGIEIFYRHFKQTFNKRKLRSDSPDNASLELEWSLLGLWAMALYTLIEAHHAGTAAKKVSTAQMLLAFRRTMRDYLHPYEREESLCRQLRKCIIDSYQRKNKTSRNYPRKKKETPPGSPVINLASTLQVDSAKAVLAKYKKGLTA
jgi:hypothetical protein